MSKLQLEIRQANYNTDELTKHTIRSAVEMAIEVESRTGGELEWLEEMIAHALRGYLTIEHDGESGYSYITEKELEDNDE
jgi:hypothetical protein